MVKTSFEALHHWATCNLVEVSYLKNLHRHIFNVTVKIRVGRLDREVEFIQAKHYIRNVIQDIFRPFVNSMYRIPDLGSTSCEMIAEMIHGAVEKYTIKSILVDEDGENGVEFNY